MLIIALVVAFTAVAAAALSDSALFQRKNASAVQVAAAADSSGITLQTLIVTAVLVLMAVAAGVVIVAITGGSSDDLEDSTQDLESVDSQAIWVWRPKPNQIDLERRYEVGEGCWPNEVVRVIPGGSDAGALECATVGWYRGNEEQGFTIPSGDPLCLYSDTQPPNFRRPRTEDEVFVDQRSKRCYTADTCWQLTREQIREFGINHDCQPPDDDDDDDGNGLPPINPPGLPGDG